MAAVTADMTQQPLDALSRGVFLCVSTAVKAVLSRRCSESACHGVAWLHDDERDVLHRLDTPSIACIAKLMAIAVYLRPLRTCGNVLLPALPATTPILSTITALRNVCICG